ncbi:MAG: hypothetical protein M1457_14330 [bacterium]|nr:hypothetical protein [bacterium]
MRNLIHQSPPPLTVDAPSQIIMTAFDQPDEKRLVVHLLNLPSLSTRMFHRSQMDTLDDISPVHGVNVTLHKGSAVRARLVPAGLDLKLEAVSGGAQKVNVPEIKEHEMIVFEFK